MNIADVINAAFRRIPDWAVYMLCAVPAMGLLYGLASGGLGVDPIRRLEHETGEWALRLVIAGLCVSPLRRWGRINFFSFRRALGVMAFVYVCLHLGTWMFLDMGLRGDLIWKDILKRPYITIGMAGFLMMLPLALTSNDLSSRRMGAVVWRKLHKLAYPAAIAAGMHFILLAKGWPTEPIVYMTLIVVLVGLRLVPRQARVAV